MLNGSVLEHVVMAVREKRRRRKGFFGHTSAFATGKTAQGSSMSFISIGRPGHCTEVLSHGATLSRPPCACACRRFIYGRGTYPRPGRNRWQPWRSGHAVPNLRPGIVNADRRLTPGMVTSDRSGRKKLACRPFTSVSMRKTLVATLTINALDRRVQGTHCPRWGWSRKRLMVGEPAVQRV